MNDECGRGCIDAFEAIVVLPIFGVMAFGCIVVLFWCIAAGVRMSLADTSLGTTERRAFAGVFAGAGVLMAWLVVGALVFLVRDPQGFIK